MRNCSVGVRGLGRFRRLNVSLRQLGIQQIEGVQLAPWGSFGQSDGSCATCKRGSSKPPLAVESNLFANSILSLGSFSRLHVTVPVLDRCLASVASSSLPVSGFALGLAGRPARIAGALQSRYQSDWGVRAGTLCALAARSARFPPAGHVVWVHFRNM